ncbi:MAG: metal-dependent hydrolase [Candidatus Hodarchaeota archaeon]
MPFTPFHFGPSLLVGLLVFPLLYIPAFLLGSVIVDVEPLVFLLLGLPVRHTFFHTFAGATIAALLGSLLLFPFRGILGDLMKIFRLPQPTTRAKLTLATLLGTYSHVILDAFLYPEMQPFWPLLGNPFLYLASSSTVLLFCGVCFILALPVFIFQVWRVNRVQRNG